MSRLAATWVAVMGVALGGCAAGVDLAQEKESLLRADREWAALASEGKDYERIASYWGDDAVIIPAGAPIVRGKAQIREFVRSSFAIPGFHIEWRSDDAWLSRDGTLGYATGRSRITFPGPDGKPMTIANRGVSVWQRDAKGDWKCVVDIWNADH